MQKQSNKIIKSDVKYNYADKTDKTLTPQTLKQLAKQVLTDIDAYCCAAYDDGHRKHLGASLIGHECERYLYYVFRWVKKEKFSGRMLRLFNRGHREEARFIEWLRGIGFDVWEVDEEAGVDDDGNPKQFRIKGVLGHFGGSLDGKGVPPYIDVPMLLEFKTSGTGHRFEALKKNGVKVEKEQHYAQMCTYGRKYGFKYALYMCINKNDDDLHVEAVALDWNYGAALEAKADRIVRTKQPPQRIASSPAFEKCKYCAMVDICHNNAPVEKNCRSCQHSEPVDGGKWFCHTFQQEIPDEYIAQGCNNHLGIQ